MQKPKKTLSDLNSNWQYRLIKVIYTLTFVGIFLFLCYHSAGWSYIYNEEKNTYITKEVCTDNNELNGKVIKNMAESIIYKEYCKNNDTKFIKEYVSGSGLAWSNWLFGLYVILSLCGTILAFELIRRIFYYIVLGTLEPKK